MTCHPKSAGEAQSALTAAAKALEARIARQDWLLDQALLGTFPASDPISVARFD
jgi:hypothetical protein